MATTTKVLLTCTTIVATTVLLAAATFSEGQKSEPVDQAELEMKIAKEVLGTVVYRNENVVVGVREDAQGAGVLSVLTTPGGRNHIELNLDTRALKYTVGTPPTGIIWDDLNGDGEFDQRMILTNDYDLKFLIRRGEMWTAVHGAGKGKVVVLETEARLRFDEASGEWVEDK